MIVGPKNTKRGKACALPLFADAKIRRKPRFTKTRPVVPPVGKVLRSGLAEAVGGAEQDAGGVNGEKLCLALSAFYYIGEVCERPVYHGAAGVHE